MDWVKQGKELLHYQLPPKAPTDDETKIFEDGLKETVPKKLGQAAVRFDYLQRKREAKLRVIQRRTKKGSLEEYIAILYAEHEYSEAYYIEKWINYWTSILERIAGKKPSVKGKQNKITDSDIERAKEYPLENLYNEILKKAGSRLLGLCQFHEEKTPSFFIFPDNHYHCYGCGEHGDPITFAMKTKNLSFPEAVRYLS